VSLRLRRPVVVGVDIGTTSTKVIGYDVAGRRAGEADASYPLDEPHPGEAVQDPDAIVAAVTWALARVVGQARHAGAEVVGVSFSSAMHSLIGLGADGRPVTPSVTWADLRATAQAERLRAIATGRELHQRTGTPVHPMSPLVKLLWFREHLPETFAAARRWMGIKEYVVAQLTGQEVMDRSIASGWGMMDLTSLDWYPDAVALCGLRPDQLLGLVATNHQVSFTPAARHRLGLGDVPLIVGAGDGPLANLGAGAVRPGVAACSIGTSGALRIIVEEPRVDAGGRVFCYALEEGRWAVGGAISNGGIVLQWAAEALVPELGAGGIDELLGEAATVPPGSEGLLMLPYLLSERAPYWDARAAGAYVGLSLGHRRRHLARAAREGVCEQLALVLASLRGAGHRVDEVRATGGALRRPMMRQLLTDVLGMDVGFAPASEGSGFGAALLGMQALGLVDSLEMAAGLVTVNEVRHPDPAAAEVYRGRLPVVERVYDALAPTFGALRPTRP
jgi:gluconokinase